MATTTGGTTYVTSTDLVANYPTASLALANRVDVVASGGPNSIKTAGYTITLADILGGNKFLYNSASPGTFTLPTSGLVDGMTVDVAQIGAGALTVSGGTIVGTTVTTAQYQGLRFVYASTGASWYSIAPAATAPGLATVTPTSIANSGGSATATGGEVTFTGVSSISLNGIFSTTYENYLVRFTNLTTSGAGNTVFRLRASGTDATASYTTTRLENVGTSVGGVASPSSAFWSPTYLGASAPAAAMDMTIYRPRIAAATSFIGQADRNDSVTTIYYVASAGYINDSTAYDGFSLLPGGGTLSGIVRVYGYKNS